MPPPASLSLSVGRRPLRVLLVDDDARTGQLLGEALRLFGAEVRTAESVAAARSLIGAFMPDLVVSDVGMAKESGYDLIRELRALPRCRGGATPAIACTGYASPADRERALGAGYQDVVAKPVDLDLLLHSIVRLSATPGSARGRRRPPLPAP